MKIIVVGCGKIGETIIKSLLAENHNIVAIDNSPDTLGEVTNIYDIMGVCGNGSDCEVLSEAGIEHTELFVAVTGSDEMNMLSCYIARKMGAKHTIARIRNPEYNAQSLGFLKQELHLSMAINPEMLAAEELFNILKLPSALKIEPFSRRNFEMVELLLKPSSPLDGVMLSDLRKKYQASFLICVVQRGNNVYIPDGRFVLRSGDKIGITATPNEILRLLRMLGLQQKQARNVMIMGASTTAFYLARLLLNGGNSVKIIEKNPQRCSTISEELSNAVIIHGDGAQQELLHEEGLCSTDAFVTLTGMDEENILIAFYASSQNVPKVIAKVNREELSAMAEKLGLNCLISPKKIIADVLVRYARALQNSIGSKVETLYNLMDGKVEALEFDVLPDFSHLNIPLKEMKLKANILIAGILRGRKAFIPAGDDRILAGDKIILIAAGRQIRDLTDILK